MRRITAAGLTVAGLFLAACSAPPAQPQHQAGRSTGGANQRPVGPPGVQAQGVLRLGMSQDITSAPALLGWQLGYFGQDLGQITLEPQAFTSAVGEVAAMRSGQLDAAYLDPVTAIQAWQDNPGLIKIVAGAASGGAELVVTSHVTSPAQLKGHLLTAPPASAQQAAADHWLRQHHLPRLTLDQAAAPSGPALLSQFRSGKIVGAWEPPPLNAQLTAAGGHVLLTEASLWPRGQYPTAVLAVTVGYLTSHPRAVTALLQGQAQASRLLTTSPSSAQAALAQRLTALGHPLPARILAQSLAQLTFTEDPLPGPLLAEARHAATAGLIKPIKNLTSIYDLSPLNQLRKTTGQPPVKPQ